MEGKNEDTTCISLSFLRNKFLNSIFSPTQIFLQSCTLLTQSVDDRGQHDGEVGSEVAAHSLHEVREGVKSILSNLHTKNNSILTTAVNNK